jgi:hypothetical protein
MSHPLFRLCISGNRKGRTTMRLLQRVRSCLKPTKKPQHKFVTHLLGLMLLLPGHATVRTRSRDRP